MKRKWITFGIAAIAVCFMAGEVSASDLPTTSQVTKLLMPVNIRQFDTTDAMVLPDSTMNDTVTFYSDAYEVPSKFTAIVGQVLQTEGDTATATGFSADSVIVSVETKLKADSMVPWWTLWTSALTPLASFDSADGWARGAGMHIYIPSDSLSSMMDYYRVRFDWIAEEDSFIVEAADTLINGADTTYGTVTPIFRIVPELLFK